MRVELTHFREQGQSCALFRADARDHSQDGRRQLLAGLIVAAKRSRLRVDKAALAFEEFGQVPAGSPFLADENIEGWVRLPKALAGPPSDTVFLLHVRGTSMNRARVEGGTIDDGDLILVRQQHAADNGDVIVALIDGEVTVKQLVTAPGYCVLKPVSKDTNHRPIMVEDEFRVVGKVRRVLKGGSSLLRTVFEDR